MEKEVSKCCGVGTITECIKGKCHTDKCAQKHDCKCWEMTIVCLYKCNLCHEWCSVKTIKDELDGIDI